MPKLDFLDLFASEIVIGLVAPLGTETSIVHNALIDSLKAFEYSSVPIKLSDFLQDIGHGIELKLEPEVERIKTHMDAGDRVREILSEAAGEDRGDALALFAAMEIQRLRKGSDRNEKTAYILHSLKHPDEVEVLRKIYGNGFFLLGVYSPEGHREQNLVRNRGMSKEEARTLIARDNNDETPRNAGQQTRETFHLADAFVSLINQDDAEKQIERVIDLIFGDPFITPTRDEYAMFHAFTSALRSADLSRQVGAVIVNESGELISLGANDVPCAGGGLYWPGPGDKRDYVWRVDSNAQRREEILANIVELLKNRMSDSDKKNDKELYSEVKKALSHSLILDITEFGRPVHAEMESILSCARNGSSTRNATLYCTTFPCHNCAKHIVAAGIKRVVYVEPYPKSKARELHGDSIDIDGECSGRGKVEFVPFVGMGARRFIDLFSMGLGSGYPLRRKKRQSFEKADWSRKDAKLRVPMLRTDYLERETFARGEIKKQFNQEEAGGENEINT